VPRGVSNITAPVFVVKDAWADYNCGAENLAEYKEENRGVAEWLYGAKMALGDNRDAPALSCWAL
jgi:hypothetical protein